MIHKKRSPGLIRICLLIAVALTLAVPASAEWKEKVLYSFQGGTNDGALPVGGVVFGTQGNLYGVLQFYGPGSCGPIGNECGAVFQLAPPAHQGDPSVKQPKDKFCELKVLITLEAQKREGRMLVRTKKGYYR